MLFYNPKIDKKKYVVAKYYIECKKEDLSKAAWNLAIGQSVGNPNVRNKWETNEIFEMKRKHDLDLVPWVRQR